MKLSDMQNIGVTLEEMLNDVGIKDSVELVKIGSLNAIMRLHVSGNACISKLYAIEGAIQNVRWHKLSPEYRKQLKSQYLDLIG